MQDTTKYHITKGFLILAAIVTGVVAIYTTALLFQTTDTAQLSPNNLPEGINLNNTDNQTGVSFEINQTAQDDFEKNGNLSNKTFKTEEIPPADPKSPPQPGPIDLLATLDDLEAERSTALLLIVLLEMLVIYFVYKKLNVILIKKPQPKSENH